METEVSKDKTIGALAEVLEREGIAVRCHREYGSVPIIIFNGDDATGFRALELAWREGYYPQGLVKDWLLDYTAESPLDEPDYSMVFEDEEPRKGANQVVIDSIREDYPTLDDIRRIFKNHGFDIRQCHEGETELFDDHLITFKGNFPDEGFRAFEVALNHGLPMSFDPIAYTWECWMDWETGKQKLFRDNPRWKIHFRTEGGKARRRNILCFCGV